MRPKISAEQLADLESIASSLGVEMEPEREEAVL